MNSLVLVLHIVQRVLILECKLALVRMQIVLDKDSIFFKINAVHTVGMTSDFLLGNAMEF